MERFAKECSPMVPIPQLLRFAVRPQSSQRYRVLRLVSRKPLEFLA